MIDSSSTVDKGTGSIDSKPATVVVQTPEADGEDRKILDATHHIVTGEIVHLYLGARSGGIDVTVPVSRCLICRSDRARKLFSAGIDSRTGDGSGSHSDGDSGPHADSEKEFVMDGGRDVIEPGDYVIHEYPAVNVPDLWQVTGVHHYDRVNVDDFADGEPAPLNDVPAHTVYDLRTQDGEHHTAAVHEDDVERAQTGAMDIIIEDEDDELELVTDGGIELVSGDDVLHAGEQYQVARCDGSNVEIYQLGARSLIVPIDTVEPVPEVSR